MKYLFLFFILACAPTTFCADAGREIAKKEVTEHFPSSDAALQWNPASLPLKQWLDFITFPDWQLLCSTETDESYFALFRNGDYLILWNANRKPPSNAPSGQTSIEIIAKADGRVVWEAPSKWASIEYRLEYPHGAYTSRDQGLAFKIKDDFHGQLILKVSKETEKKASQPVFRQEVMWTR